MMPCSVSTSREREGRDLPEPQAGAVSEREHRVWSMIARSGA